MIEVNLLPEDRRPVERTPIPRFLTILAGVAGFCIEGVFLLLLIGLFPEKRNALRDLNLRLQQAEDRVKQVKEIEARIADIKKRRDRVEKLYNDRRVWAPILYRLCDPGLLPSRVWFKRLELVKSRTAGPRGGETQTLLIDGYAWAADENDEAAMLQAYLDFLEKLREPYPQFTEYFAGAPELGRVEMVKLSAVREAPADAPKQALAFSLRLPLKAIAPAAPPKQAQ